MRILLGLATIALLGSALSGCVAVDAVSTVAGAATSVAGTAVDVGTGVVSGAARTVGGGSDKDSSGN